MNHILQRILRILSATLLVLSLVSASAAVYMFSEYSRREPVASSPHLQSFSVGSLTSGRRPTVFSNDFFSRTDLHLYTGSPCTILYGDGDTLWRSSDPEIVSVEGPGTLLPKKPGTAVISAETPQETRLYGVTVSYSLRYITAGQPLSGTHLFVYDVAENALLFSRGDMDASVYPASLTKLMTAYVAMLYLPEDGVFYPGEEVRNLPPDSSVAALPVDTPLSREQLIAALLLPSGNDAALTVAIQTGWCYSGNLTLSAEDAMGVFMAVMNRVGWDIGLRGSHFVNPHGYHDPAHYTTTADLITFSLVALSDPTIRSIFGQETYSVPLGEGKDLLWTTHVPMLCPDSKSYCPYVTGGKTGFTTPAGSCMIVSVEFEGKTYLVGTLGAGSTVQRDMDILILMENYIFAPFAKK